MVREINLNHICKIEGHASLSLKIEKNKVIECELKATEGARFFEALVLGRKIEDIQEIVSRICGICSSAHSVACIQALENALSIKPTEAQKIIRDLLMTGERIRSHITHLYFLALPDYFGLSSALDLSKQNHDKVEDALKLISLGNKIIQSIGGRDIHPFLQIKEQIPKKESFSEIISELENAKPLIKKTINLFMSLKYPSLERETDYFCLRDKEYTSISGKLVSQSGIIEVQDYKKHISENIKEYATSKFALKDQKPFQVGAIARLNNNSDEFDSETKEFVKKLKLPLKSPYQNNIAQAIELLHLANTAIKLFKKLETLPEEKTTYKLKEGHGVSAVEAPRGTLFHEYQINKEGKIELCNIITPTVQNLNMMESDIKQLVNGLLDKGSSKEKIIQEVEKLIRAYDPCFSCSTHFLKVKWVEE